MPSSETNLFDAAKQFPDPAASQRLNSLVGIDEQKKRLEKALGVLISPQSLIDWTQKYHPSADQIVSRLMRRPPLVILAGDVGSGKTELATNIGDALARTNSIEITLFPMSLSARGQGRVGEMTRLVSQAFNIALSEAKKIASIDGVTQGAVILLIDEADALAQSRETEQMHHEDRAGVNAFIRGIDQFAAAKVPAAVIMCTNRLNALDPAIRRRAAEILTFERPDELKRELLLSTPLKELGFDEESLSKAILMTGARDQGYGFTYSDLVHRVLPGIVLQAFPNGPVNPRQALDFISNLEPTPPFNDS